MFATRIAWSVTRRNYVRGNDNVLRAGDQVLHVPEGVVGKNPPARSVAAIFAES